MNNRYNLTLLIFIFLYVAYHVSTLAYSPLPWFDDTYFASIANSFIQTGKMIPTIAYHAREGKESLTYGPVYFILTGLSMKVFGIGIFQFRIVNMLASFVCFITFMKITGNRERSVISAMLTSVALSLDPFTNLSMHEGRMDLLCVAFMLMGLYYIEKSVRLRKGKNMYLGMSGSFFAMSLLTTPRAGLTLMVVFLVLLIDNLTSDEDTIIPFLAWLTPIVVLYGTWIMLAFGSPLKFYKYYMSINDGGPFGANHYFVGGDLYIPRHEYLLIGIAVLCLCLGLAAKGRLYFNKLTVISVLSIAAFYIVVRDWGPYSVYIIPFYYYIIFRTITLRPIGFSNIAYIALLVLLVFNFSYTTLKSTHVLANLSQRNPYLSDEFISKNIPKGSKVLGDGLHYFSVIKSGSQYEYFDKFESMETREERQRMIFDYDYIIISQTNEARDPEVVNHYLRNSRFIKIAELRTTPSYLTAKISSWGVVSAMEDDGYNAVIYARVKDHNKKSPMAMLK